MAELVVNVVPEVEGLRRLTQELAELESKKFVITDPQQLTQIVERSKELRSQIEAMAKGLSAPNAQTYVKALDQTLSELAKQAEISGYTINKYIGAVIRESAPELQEAVKKIADEVAKQADEAMKAMSNFKGEAKELAKLEDRWAKLSDAAKRYSVIVDGMNDNKTSEAILQEAAMNKNRNQTSTKSQTKTKQEFPFSAYEDTYVEIADIIDKNDIETIEKAKEELKWLTDEVKRTTQAAAEAKEAYEAMKASLPNGANAEQVKELKRAWKEAEEEVETAKIRQEAAQDAITDKATFSAFEEGYKKIGDAIKESQGKGEDALQTLKEATEEAEKAANNAKNAYESLKKALPEGADTQELNNLKTKMEQTAEKAEQLRQKMQGAQAAMDDLGGGSNNLNKKFDRFSTKLLGGKKNVDALRQAFSMLPAPLAQVASGFGAITKAALTFIATPIGAILAAVVLAVKGVSYAIDNAISTTDKSMDDLIEKQNTVIELKAGWNAFGKTIVDNIAKIGDVFIDLKQGKYKEAFSDLWQAAKNHLNFWNIVSEKEDKYAEVMKEEANLARERTKWVEKESELDAKVAEARAAMYETNDQSKRLEHIQAAENAINEKYAQRIKFAKEDLKIAEQRKDLGRNGAEDYAKVIEAQRTLNNLQRQQNQELRFLKRQETAANKAIAQEEINDRYESIETDNKQQKSLNSLSDKRHTKAVTDIRLDEEAQLAALEKKLELDLLKVDESNSEKRIKLEERYQRDKENIIALANAKREKENRDFLERTRKEMRDNSLAIAKEQVEVSDNMSEAIVRDIKKRYGIQEDITNKAIILIELEKQAEINALNDKIAAWQKTGEYSPANQAYATAKAAQIEAETAKKIAETTREMQSDVADKADELNKGRLDTQQDTLRKRIALIDIEKKAQLRALEEEKRKWIETYGEMSEAVKELYAERKKLTKEEAEEKKRKELLETYLPAYYKFAERTSLYASDRETLMANGYIAQAHELDRQAQEEKESIGMEYLEQNKKEYAEWLQDIGTMSTEELISEANKIEKKIKALEAEGKAGSQETMVFYGKLGMLKQAGENSEKRLTKVVSVMNKAFSTASASVDALTEGASEGTKEVVDGMMSIAENGIEMISNISSLTQVTIDSTKGTAEAASTAIKGVERASVILAIIGAAIQIVMKLNSLLGGDKSRQAYDKAVEKQKEINKMADSVAAYTRAVREAELAEKSWFSSSSFSSIRDNWALATEASKEYYRKLNEQQLQYQDRKAGRTGLGKLTEDWLKDPAKFEKETWNPITGAYYSTKGTFSGSTADYDTNLVSARNNLRFETQSRKHGTWFRKGRDQKTMNLEEWAEQTYGEKLFDASGMINTTMAANILENYEDKLVGETKETLEKLKAEAEAYKEAIDSIKSAVADMYSPLVDDMTNAVWTWLDTGEDALSTFKDSAGDTFAAIAKEMIKTMANELIFNKMSKELETLAEDYAKGNMDEETFTKKSLDLVDATMKNAEASIDTMEQVSKRITDYAEQKGYDILGKSDEQKASYGGYETMSEQTGTELSGRFSAMYIVQSEHLGVAKQIQASILDINKFLPNLRDEMRNVSDDTHEMAELMANGLVELRAINGTTDAIKKLAVRLDERTEVWSKHITNL